MSLIFNSLPEFHKFKNHLELGGLDDDAKHFARRRVSGLIETLEAAYTEHQELTSKLISLKAKWGELTEEDAQGFLWKETSYGRIPMLLHEFAHVEDKLWLRMLGKFWCCSDNIGKYQEELLDMIREKSGQTEGPIVELMDEEELAAYEALPNMVTVYRGCYEHNKWGFSWSLDREQAEGFPFLSRYCQEGRPLLIKGQIEKRYISAIKLGRNESEVICGIYARPKCISISTAKRKLS